MRSDSKNTKPKGSKENNILENSGDATDAVAGSPTTTDRNQSSFLEEPNSGLLLDKGSSSNKILGSIDNVLAKDALCLIPPDSSLGFFSIAGVKLTISIYFLI